MASGERWSVGCRKLESQVFVSQREVRNRAGRERMERGDRPGVGGDAEMWVDGRQWWSLEEVDLSAGKQGPVRSRSDCCFPQQCLALTAGWSRGGG